MTEPDAMCEAFAIALHTAPAGGNLQPAAYATDDLALELAADPGRHPAGSEDGHPGGAAVDTGPYAGHLPPDRDGHSHRAVVLRSGGDAEEPRWIVYCTLQQVGDQWRVAAYEREPRP
ncbi:hypothetical protein JQS43_19710 [Natronosporangium hydrolyticum]|uniref:Uncharacterized protein n=1 Tax=Natronosporangium hydrolyticum TaxID=2811111 RepID=A0A895Y7S5_9ACTN|nr:hypothetical protein [Natronosporangium hydrolyticum]QSB13767.1 hypothetical protein JQS43_19710 [Natronosporangium hydrolyticum]